MKNNSLFFKYFALFCLLVFFSCVENNPVTNLNESSEEKEESNLVTNLNENNEDTLSEEEKISSCLLHTVNNSTGETPNQQNTSSLLQFLLLFSGQTLPAFLEQERRTILNELYEYVKREYYWYDAIKEISYTNTKYYDTTVFPYQEVYQAQAAIAYFNDMRYSKDKWSRLRPPVSTTSSSNNDKAYGFRYAIKQENDDLFLRVTRVLPNSPVARAGMQRGDRIISFQATTSTRDNSCKDIIHTTLVTNLNVFFQEVTYSTSGNFVLQDASGARRTISPSKEIFELDYFLNINQGETTEINKRFSPTLIPLSNSKNTLTKNIGYAIYTGFDKNSVPDILNMFYFWKQNQVKDVIFDLRYNGGGRLDVTQLIVSMLLDDLGKVFAKLDFRDVNPRSDETLYVEKVDSSFLLNKFKITGYPVNNIVNLGIESAYFLVTESSASASELLIKALQPYIDVTVIGENTQGKGYGQTGEDTFRRTVFNTNFDLYRRDIIKFKYFNANDEGVDFSGIPPTSGFQGVDDITQNWGAGENLFDLAINDLQAKLEQQPVTAPGRSFSPLAKKSDNTYYSFPVNPPEEDRIIPYEKTWQ